VRDVVSVLRVIDINSVVRILYNKPVGTVTLHRVSLDYKNM